MATEEQALQLSFERLRHAWLEDRPAYEQRLDDLKRLRERLEARLDEMAKAISADFGIRSLHETLLGEASVVFAEIDDALHNLKRWMKPKRRKAGWKMWPAKAEIRYVPLGVVGIIAPWNYPVNLALAPLVAAIAAGNHVFLKPSEHTPRTAEFLQSMLADVFPEDRVTVALGDASLSAQFASLPFDHLFFTGSTAVGRKIMAAAAPNLTPVTLELGGKSPAIVSENANLKRAARAIASAEKDRTTIINDAQEARLSELLADAANRSEVVIELPAGSEQPRSTAPALVLEPDADSTIMREEIFGPLLPIVSYRLLDDAIGFVLKLDRPLALYCFSDNTAEIEMMLSRIVAGGVCVNDTLYHFACSSLPFGGVGASGMGQYHGHDGFLTFSKAMPVLTKYAPAPSDLIKPPYTGLTDRLIRFIAR